MWGLEVRLVANGSPAQAIVCHHRRPLAEAQIDRVPPGLGLLAPHRHLQQPSHPALLGRWHLILLRQTFQLLRDRTPPLPAALLPAALLLGSTPSPAALDFLQRDEAGTRDAAPRVTLRLTKDDDLVMMRSSPQVIAMMSLDDDLIITMTSS